MWVRFVGAADCKHHRYVSSSNYPAPNSSNIIIITIIIIDIIINSSSSSSIVTIIGIITGVLRIIVRVVRVVHLE